MRLAALAVLLSSCSWLAVTPPAMAPNPPGDCTTSQAAPAIDAVTTAIGIAGVALGALFVGDAENHTCRPGIDQNCETYGAEAGFGIILIVPSAVLGIAYGLSARSGFHDTALCRARKAGSS